ncbi:tetratricopeptide repeat protein [Robertkochia aurantiaca]|uniref:tetratricopeptide repeat protein n=1 Tax=Robertkochia aurantiaca TaxID=2873700 RepID=UPI001CCE5F55|nr:tetratricopeptide repeat protein [Robertkochia sp. 3YJGBD-33]
MIRYVLALAVFACVLSVTSCKSDASKSSEHPPFEQMVQPGDSLFLTGDFDKAITEFRKVARAYPDSLSVKRALARAYMGVGLFNDAEEMLRETEKGDDTISRLRRYRRFAILGMFRGDTAQLRQYNDSILRIAFHSYPQPYVSAAFNEVFLREFEEAKAHLERYVAYGEPEQIPINLGYLYLRAGDTLKGREILEIAETQLTAVLLENPADHDALFELAEISLMKKDTAAAMDYINKSLVTGLGKEWWIYHFVSEESLSDPVFEPLSGHPPYERIRDSLYKQRQLMKAKVMGE